MTDQPIADLNELRNKRVFYIVKKILAILLKENIPISDMDFLSRRIIMSINESFKLANERLWGVSESDQTFVHVQRILVPSNHTESGVKSPIQPKDL